jgi:hypothetical protein
MKRFIIEQSDEEFYTSTSGISLIGLGLNRFMNLASSIAKAVPLSHGISHADVIKSFCALLAQGKSDYVAIEQHREDDFFREALGLSPVPSEATLRQRMDDHAAEFLRVVSWETVEFLMKAEVPLTSLSTGHIAVDIDGFAMDNSGTKKECVSRTYRNFDGYLAMPVYLADVRMADRVSAAARLPASAESVYSPFAEGAGEDSADLQGEENPRAHRLGPRRRRQPG